MLGADGAQHVEPVPEEMPADEMPVPAEEEMPAEEEIDWDEMPAEEEMPEESMEPLPEEMPEDSMEPLPEDPLAPAEPAEEMPEEDDQAEVGPQYVCSVCQHVYDPAVDGAGSAFEDLPEDWKCPVCGEPKSAYAPADPVFV